MTPRPLPALLWAILLAAFALRAGLADHESRGQVEDSPIFAAQFDPAFSARIAGIPELERNFRISRTGYPPLYSGAIHVLAPLLGGDRRRAGQWLNLLAGTGTVAALFFLGRVLAGDRAGLWAAGLGAAQPLLVLWDGRGNAEPFFTFPMTLAALCWLRWTRERAARDAALFVAAAGCAAAVKYEGLVYLPLALFLVWKEGRRAPGAVLAATLPWALALGWLLHWGLAIRVHDYRNAAALVGGGEAYLRKTALWALQSLAAQDAILTTPVLLLALAGLAVAARRREDPAFLGAVLYVLAAWVATRAVNSNWTTRYFHTTTPLLLLYAARGMVHAEARLAARRGLVHGLQVLTVAWPLGFAVAGARLERDALGDVRRAAEFLRTYAPGRELRGADVSFTAAWAERPILPYSAEAVVPHSLVILSSLPLEVRQRTTIGAEYQKLRERFQVREVFRAESVSTGLLGDSRDAKVLLETRIGPGQLRHRWETARNVTLVYEIGEARRAGDSPSAP